jgi:hypothetical protein
VSVKQLTSAVYEVALGAVNVWLLMSDDGVVLIGTGMAGHAETILQAACDLNQGTICHILLTHAQGGIGCHSFNGRLVHRLMLIRWLRHLPPVC